MLQIPAWKRVLIWAACALGLILALPNGFYDRVERSNDAEARIAAGFVTDDNAADAGLWPGFLPSGLVNLGLDLRGGAHLLAEVALEEVYETRLEGFWP
ncbi:MAG: protein translocase subunit SecD, partial [Pseudomonadota bacterium]